eukprot:1186270-Prorocentrum_minimum.AAC.4
MGWTGMRVCHGAERALSFGAPHSARIFPLGIYCFFSTHHTTLYTTAYSTRFERFTLVNAAGTPGHPSRSAWGATHTPPMPREGRCMV